MSDFQALRGRKTTTCTYHCSACGCHFHSLEAFDAHRTGDFASDGPLGRRCVHPLDMDGRLVSLTDAGECRVRGLAERGAVIWTSDRTKGRRPWERPSEGSGQAESGRIEVIRDAFDQVDAEMFAEIGR